jgi:hypothetical protein
LPIQIPHDKNLAVSRKAEMCQPFILRWVNYAASAYFSSSSGEHFNDFWYLKKGLHWRKLLSISSQVFTIGFSMGTESLNHDVYSTCVQMFESACAKIFILSLTVS